MNDIKNKYLVKILFLLTFRIQYIKMERNAITMVIARIVKSLPRYTALLCKYLVYINSAFSPPMTI